MLTFLTPVLLLLGLLLVVGLARVTTVKVKHPDPKARLDYIVINEADYDPDTHELVEGEDSPDTGPPGDPGDDLEEQNVPDLREIASELEITNYSSLRKGELIAAIREARAEAGAAADAAEE